MKWSSRGGAAGAAASPLVKPDVRISRIRLTRRDSSMNMHGKYPLGSPTSAVLGRGLKSVVGRSQAEHASSCLTTLRQDPFAPPELPRFIATMNPSDSRSQPGRGYSFPRPVVPAKAGTPRRVSQVPNGSVAIRRPQPPRGAGPLHMLVASWSVLASPLMEGWPLPDLSHEAESGSLALRLTASPSRASSRRVAPRNARSATWPTSNYHGPYLSTNKNPSGLA